MTILALMVRQRVVAVQAPFEGVRQDPDSQAQEEDEIEDGMFALVA